MVAGFIEELQLHEVVVAASVPTNLKIIRDPDDRCAVATAQEGKAEVLVTGDNDILDVRDKISELGAMTTREFWESVRTSK